MNFLIQSTVIQNKILFLKSNSSGFQFPGLFINQKNVNLQSDTN